MALRKAQADGAPGGRFPELMLTHEITKTGAEAQPLVRGKMSRTGGRYSHGRKTARHRGRWPQAALPGFIDFRPRQGPVSRPRVAAIEYDPNRNARIALLHLPRRRERTSLPPRRASASATWLQSGPRRRHRRPGKARLPLQGYVPGPARSCTSRAASGRGGKARPGGRHERPGSWAKEGSFATLPPAFDRDASGVDRLPGHLGEVGNSEAELISIGKAGRNRWKGVPARKTPGVSDEPRRPSARVVAKERHWWPASGSPRGAQPEGRTRRRHRAVHQLIIRRRRTRGARR